MKFENIADDWLKFKKPSVKPSTYSTYNFIIQTRILDVFEEKTIKQLLKYNFNEYVEILINQRLDSKTIKDTIIILKQILNYTKVKFRCRIKYSINKYTKIERKRNNNI